LYFSRDAPRQGGHVFEECILGDRRKNERPRAPASKRTCARHAANSLHFVHAFL
jgi:hypothetical protein